jgi:hypothetical protein
VGFSLLTKGSSSNFFSSFRGLRQGDPISPYLFILVEEVLSRGISKIAKERRIGSFSLKNGLIGPYMLFVDDLIYI